MLPKYHIILSLIFVALLYLILPSLNLLELTIIFFSAVLIDFDHYLYYVYKKRNLSLKKAFKWFLKLRDKYLSIPKSKRSSYFHSFCIFHASEPFILLIILAVFFPLFLFILLGATFHLLLDFIYHFALGAEFTCLYSDIYKIHLSRTRKNLSDLVR